MLKNITINQITYVRYFMCLPPTTVEITTGPTTLQLAGIR